MSEQGISIDIPEQALTKFKNDKVSVSRLNLFEQCSLAFQFRYVHKAPKDPQDATFLVFGTLLHETLEATYKWIVLEQYEGVFPTEEATTFYRNAWQRSGLTGLDLFQEGLQLIRTYASTYTHVSHHDVLGIEMSFDIRLEEFTVTGFIDRIDKVNDDTVRIVDYKSNRLLFSSTELDSNLQMSVYAIAILDQWPWVNNVEFEFHMLRHGHPLRTTRTKNQLEDAKMYVVETSRRTEMGEYAPRINGNCVYCDYRSLCPAYQAQISMPREAVVREPTLSIVDDKSLEAVLYERERYATLAKLFYARKDSIDKTLRTYLDTRDKIEVGGFSVSLENWSKEIRYDIDRVVGFLKSKLTIPEAEILKAICSVDRSKFDTFLAALESAGVPRNQILVIKAELELFEERIPGQPRLYVRAPKTPKKSPELPALQTQAPGQLQAPAAGSAQLPEGVSVYRGQEEQAPDPAVPARRRRGRPPKKKPEETPLP